MPDIDARVLEECAKAARDAWIDSPPTVDWNSVARAVLTTARQQGAGRVPLSKTLDRWDSEDLTARLAAAEKVVEAARKLSLNAVVHINGVWDVLARDMSALGKALAAYPPTPQTEVKG